MLVIQKKNNEKMSWVEEGLDFESPENNYQEVAEHNQGIETHV